MQPPGKLRDRVSSQRRGRIHIGLAVVVAEAVVNGLTRFSGSEAGEWPTHVFPRQNDIIVGGTYEVGVEEIDATEEIDNEIIDRATRMEPAIAGTKRIGAKSGFRPSRPTVRLEAETFEGKTIVHNYGHGGGGVTLSWGCANDVAQLVASAEL